MSITTKVDGPSGGDCIVIYIYL